MPTLIINGDCLSVNAESKRLNIVRKYKDKDGKSHHNKSVIPIHDIDRVVIIGRPLITVPVLQRLMFNGIPCYFTTTHNHWIGSLQPDGNKDAARRLRQYRVAGESNVSLRIAKAIVEVKIRNQRRVLQRLASNRVESMQHEQQRVCAEMKQLAQRVNSCQRTDEIRGMEGLAAALYFGRLGKFFPKDVPFTVRSRRPPKDAANALLSWTYTIALGEVECEVRKRGLDPCIGFLHELSHGTPSLALDLLEPLRAPLCDLLVLNILNHNILTIDSFEYIAEKEGVYLREEARKPFFQAYETSMTRKFSLAKGTPHTDFRNIISDMVSMVLNAMNGNTKINFFRMP